MTRVELMKSDSDGVIVKGYGKASRKPRRGQTVLPVWDCRDLSILEGYGLALG